MVPLRRLVCAKPATDIGGANQKHWRTTVFHMPYKQKALRFFEQGRTPANHAGVTAETSAQTGQGQKQVGHMAQQVGHRGHLTFATEIPFHQWFAAEKKARWPAGHMSGVALTDYVAGKDIRKPSANQ